MELFATPELYQQLLHDNAIMVNPTPSCTSFTGDVHNVTLLEVAQFCASQGVSIANPLDMALYAVTWIQQFRSNDSELTVAFKSMQDQVIPAI